MNDLGELLIRLRGKLSLREAARRSGLSYSYISSLEKGKHPRTGASINPTPDILRSLAKAYNHSYDELMKLAGYSDGDQEEINEESEIEKMKKEIYEIVKMAQTEDDIKSMLHIARKVMKE